MVSMDQKDVISGSFRGPDLKLYVRDVRDTQDKKRAIVVRSWSTIKDVKDTINKAIHVPQSAQRLFFGPLLTSGGELPNHRTLHDAGIYRSGETLLLDIKASNATAMSSDYTTFLTPSPNDITVSSSLVNTTPKALTSIIQRARRGFALGLKPELVLDGSGGTYFLHDARKNPVAVFKPADEEPYAENNPRGYLPQPGRSMSLRDGIMPGEACIREVAAYMLDHEGFAGVPMTTLVESSHPAYNYNGLRLKVSEGGASIGNHSIGASSRTPLNPSAVPKKAGSLQEYVRGECSMDDLSPSKISAEEIHKIAILDIRLMNADRNSANLLCRLREDNTIELVPIDHGYCLRSICDVSWMDWCWLDWPQLKMPLSKKSKQYVMNIDIEADVRMLQERLNISEKALDCFRLSNMLLKAGVEAGLSLYDIAILCCRNDNLGEILSKLEFLSNMASELAVAAVENDRFHHSIASRALEEQLSPLDNASSIEIHMRDKVSLPYSRCSSTGNFLMLNTGALSMDDDEDNFEMDDIPSTMAPSSASDSTQQTFENENEDEIEQEDCNEWAANVLAGANYEPPFYTPRRNLRSSSIVSDDGTYDSMLSSSPKGFWHVRPGCAVDNHEDVSLSSSPGSSIGGFMGAAMATNGMFNRKPGVSFTNNLPKGPFIPPATVSVNTAAVSTSNSSDISSAKYDKCMPRSKSYSVLRRSHSSFSSSQSRDKCTNKPSCIGTNDSVYRTYYMKFTDLVIAREIIAATQASLAVTNKAHY